MIETRFDRRRQRTRQQLKDAAGRLILERGYDAVSIQDITDALDLGRGTFYLHFRDKQEIVAAILRDTFQQMEMQARPDWTALTLEQRDYAAFIAYFIEEEKLTLLHLVSCLLIFSGVFLVSKMENGKQ